MSDFDLLLRSRHLDGRPVAIGIAEGQFQAVAADLTGAATEEIDHTHGFLLPGWIDSHVHFNEPGRTEWEGLTTGSRALAAGGGTTFFDMPLNSSPPVLNAVSFEAKRALAEEKSCLDFALWGGLTPDSLDHLEAMAELGAIGYKAFMCPSGLDEFAHAEAATLKAGMKKAVALGLPVAVHAEINPTTRPTGHDMAAWLTSRPIQLELDAIAIALELAGETGCALHIVHVSNPEGIDLINTAKKQGVNVTVETCPHYLLLTDADAIRIGAPAKCAPPLRSIETVEALRQKIRGGEIDTIGSDHSPASPDLKQGDDFFAIWGGIAGIQHGLPLLLDHELAPAALISSNVAQRFRLANKGGFIVGHDADFSLVTPTPHTLTASALLTRHSISPYLGLTAQHQVIATYLRGQRVTSITRGQFLRPTPSLWHLASSLQSS
jgi:allantoinase